MMEFLRAALRLVALAAWTLLVFPWRLVAMVFIPVAPSLDKAVRGFIFRLWAKGALAMLGVKTTIKGQPPKEPFYLVTNHLSSLDILLLASQLGCVFISRADVQHWPLIGFITKRMNTIYIDREHLRDTLRVIDRIVHAMDRGHGVHFFAEGRIGPGDMVRPFKPALLEPAVRKGCPVHYAVITYRTPEGCLPASQAVVWRNGVRFVGHSLGLLRLPQVYADLKFCSEPMSSQNRKDLAARLREAVQAEFTPVP